jgi:DNA-binding transcriptional LysR family regulator
VAEDAARLHIRATFVHVQIGPANVGGGDLDEHISRGFDCRVGAGMRGRMGAQACKMPGRESDNTYNRYTGGVEKRFTGSVSVIMNTFSKKLGWDDLKLVMAIAETGNLAGAAAHLGVNASTIFRKLQHLELQLANILFQRHRTRYELTAAGSAIVALARRMDEDIAAVIREISAEDQQPKGELRVTTNDTLLFHILLPLLCRFKERYSDIQVKVTIENSALNVTKTDTDVSLRATDTPPNNLVGRRIGRAAWALYGRTGDYPEQTPADFAQLGECTWVTLSDDLANLDVAKFVRKFAPPGHVAFAVNSVRALADAIEAGLGIGFLPCFVGDARPSLMRLRSPPVSFGHDLWILYHPDLRRSAAVRAFVDFVVMEFTMPNQTVDVNDA